MLAIAPCTMFGSGRKMIKKLFNFALRPKGSDWVSVKTSRPLTRLQDQLSRIDEYRKTCISLKDEVLAWYRALPEVQRVQAQLFRA